ncbi:redoxin domain-containing protein [Algoriphagus halophytocola]|uniref:Redoxin domain-containing protein n=1 Tax=Algoriphagus halophytocola TaxID=2991499 RepID=A0ABY6MGP2_9BACT|nr:MULTISPECIES: redoxin domain-containing protein [unclassified Algoriphagus]UZD22803.1 redoxin domain-containing protein [Algoriphagus sp. TR-M5]WBL44069.1 redoxin domain-containing protein [Algoriphagus sp. TR-M9]
MKNLLSTVVLILLFSFHSFGQGLNDINLVDAVTGKTVNVGEEVTENGLVLIFHSLACPFAKMYESRLIALRNKYQNQGFTFIMVNPEIRGQEEDENSLRQYIDQSGVNMTYLMDHKQELIRHFDITKIPEAVVVTNGSEGHVVSYKGAIDNNPQAESAVSAKYLDKAMDAILLGQSPTPSQARAVGCNVRIY